MLPRFEPGALALFALALIASALLSDQPLGRLLVLVPAQVFEQARFWQPMTANFVFPEGQLFGLVGTLLVQWFVGGILERFWGTRRYVAMVLGAGIVGYCAALGVAAVWPAIRPLAVGGSEAMDLAAVAAFGVVFGRQSLQWLGFLPLSARSLAVLIIALSLLAPLVRGAPWPTVIPNFVAVLVALIVTLQPWRRLASSGKVRSRSRRSRRHLSVVRPDRDRLN